MRDQAQYDGFLKPGVYTVTGVVSGGRGDLGKCGGINNPVHYVRYVAVKNRQKSTIM